MISKLTTEEQEISIQSCRNESLVHMYCSDNTWITKMDKLVRKSPELFTVTAATAHGKMYEFPKRLLSIRSTIAKRTVSDEQRKQMIENLEKARNDRKERKDVL